MGNYHYIVTGLPDILPDSDSKTFSYKNVRDEVYELCSENDRELIDTLESGFDENSMNEEFYASVATSKNRFIREYFAFDRELRNLKVQHLSQRLSTDPAKYMVGEPDDYFEEREKALSILNGENIIEREKALDKLVWDKVNEITAFDFFDVEKILAFIVKARVTNRWCVMDKAKGAEFFKQLVNEVRGTFSGVKSF